MRRLICCAFAGLVICLPGPCFGLSPQAIGEAIQIQANTPAPAVPGHLSSSSRSKRRRAKTAANGQIITLAKGHYQLPPAKTTGKPQADFTVHGGDDDADHNVNDLAQKTPQTAAQTAAQTTPQTQQPLKEFRDASAASHI